MGKRTQTLDRDMAFSLQLCLEGQHLGVASSLLTLSLVFCVYYLMNIFTIFYTVE